MQHQFVYVEEGEQVNKTKKKKKYRDKILRN